jgi:hypothetical protein
MRPSVGDSIASGIALAARVVIQQQDGIEPIKAYRGLPAFRELLPIRDRLAESPHLRRRRTCATTLRFYLNGEAAALAASFIQIWAADNRELSVCGRLGSLSGWLKSSLKELI